MRLKNPDRWKVLASASLMTFPSAWTEYACIRGKKGSRIFNICQDDVESGVFSDVSDDVPISVAEDVDKACDILAEREWPDADIDKARSALLLLIK